MNHFGCDVNLFSKNSHYATNSAQQSRDYQHISHRRLQVLYNHLAFEAILTVFKQNSLQQQYNSLSNQVHKLVFELRVTNR